jgi:hypothetical protein
MLSENGSFAELDCAALRSKLVAAGVRLDGDLLTPDPAWRDGGGNEREEGVF